MITSFLLKNNDNWVKTVELNFEEKISICLWKLSTEHNLNIKKQKKTIQHFAISLLLSLLLESFFVACWLKWTFITTICVHP